MKYLDGMLELVEREFKDIVERGKFKSPDEVHMVYELIDIAKDAFCIWQYESEMDNYSETTYPYSGYHGSYDNSYNRGRSSYRSMANYDMDGDRFRNYGRSYSKADAKEDFIQDLNKMAMKFQDEELQHKVQNLIQYVERM